MLDGVLRDIDLETAVAAAIEDGFDSYASTVTGGPVMDFLQWVIENREAIFEIIAKLISLFSDAD